MAWVLPAVLLELLLYLTLSSEVLRARWTPWRLVIAAPISLLFATTGNAWKEALAVTASAAAVAFWFRASRRQRWFDFGFLVLVVVPVLFRWFKVLYVRPHPEMDIAFLGQLMWIRTTAAAVLNQRQQQGVGFGFWPTATEWRTGFIWFVAVLPVVLVLNQLIGFASLRLPRQEPAVVAVSAVATFFGILWVVAMSEELLFRGLMQRWVREATGSKWFAIVLASALFGAAHLGFRQFPNWRFSLLAGAAGIAYGLAYDQAKGIRAAMVTHALLVTVWRLFLR